MTESRNNHYVPQWYQKGFMLNNKNQFYQLNLKPDIGTRPDGSTFEHNSLKNSRPTTQCFVQTDLYTTFFGEHINDEIERKLFGEIDNIGAPAVQAFIGEDQSAWHEHFQNFFTYMDAQKIRTPKGLEWIKKHYPKLNQLELMLEMQHLQTIHCTTWVESVREVVSAKDSSIKFILTDHPITIYNHALTPESEQCIQPNDPSILLKASQTIFPLNMNHCLILTNYEYASDHINSNPLDKRSNPVLTRNSIARTDTFIRSRKLNYTEVNAINFILKQRAYRYIASPVKEWLYPEKNAPTSWSDLKDILLPPENELWQFGGETYIGYKDGSSSYHDSFGRSAPLNEMLLKDTNRDKIGAKDHCGCGSGRSYELCCIDKAETDRPTWKELSIRERNIIFINAITDILELNKGKSWSDIRRTLSSDNVADIHRVFASLWPYNTNFLDMLPQPDSTFRGLYTGNIHSRYINKIAVGLTPYFDEVLIQNPFMNPNCTNPEYSPIENPHQHKVTTLRNVLVILQLAPFIESGFINFIPNPCDFNHHLRQELLAIAKDRVGNVDIKNTFNDDFQEYALDQHYDSLFIMSDEQLKITLRQYNPAISEEDLTKQVKFIEYKKLNDPSTLIQDDLLAVGNGQMLMSHLIPNFEMSLFIAQLTGSVVYTDNNIRWSELNSARANMNSASADPYEDISSALSKLEFLLNPDLETTFSRKANDSYKNMIDKLKTMNLILKNNDSLQQDSFRTSFIQNIEEKYKIDAKAVKGADGDIKANFDFIIPQGGIVHSNAQRLLLKSGIEKYDFFTPFAIFAK